MPSLDSQPDGTGGVGRRGPLILPFLMPEVVWAHAFLTRFRRRLPQRIGDDLGVRIVDGPKGAWAAAPGSGLVNVGVLDITLLIGATLGP